MSGVQSILLQCVTGLLAGVFIGAVHFGGLWWTTQQLTVSQRPGALFLTSLLIRMSLLVGMLFAMTRIGAATVLASVFGTLIARFCLIRIINAYPTGADR